MASNDAPPGGGGGGCGDHLPETKRQRLDDGGTIERCRREDEQRAAFEEDMARIRSADANVNHGTWSASSATAAVGMGGMQASGGEVEGRPTMPTSQQQRPRMQQQRRSMMCAFPTVQQQQTQQLWRHSPPPGAGGHSSDGDSDGDGDNWLRNFTSHRTRVGDDYQVTDLPAPPVTGGATPITDDITPRQRQRRRQGEGQARPQPVGGRSDSDSDGDGGDNWLQNFTSHRTRVGSDYQATDLPPAAEGGRLPQDR